MTQTADSATTEVAEVAEAPPVLPPVWLLRAVRVRTQRLLDVIEQIAAGGARLGEHAIRGEFGSAVRAQYDQELIPQAQELARRGAAQLRRLRAAEAAARGVAVTAVEGWITSEDDDETDTVIRGRE